MKHTIYFGGAKPAVLVGKHQINLGNFAFEHRGWHSYKKNDRDARRAIESLLKKGYLEHSAETLQFRWK